MMQFTLGFLDRPTYAVIAARREATDLDERHDILSLLLQARTEDGEALTDHELRDELITLVLAGHETTANTLAWTWERLVRDAGRAGAAGRGGALRRRGGVRRGDRGRDPRGDALAARDPDHRPAGDGAVADGRLRRCRPTRRC